MKPESLMSTWQEEPIMLETLEELVQ